MPNGPRSKQRSNKLEKVVAYLVLLLILIALAGAIVPYKTRVLGLQASCGAGPGGSSQRFQRFFADSAHNAKAFESAKPITSQPLGILCIRGGYHPQQQAAQLYLW